jgi:hypothetical protein
MKRRAEPLRVGPALAARPGAPRDRAQAVRVELPRARTWLMHATIATVFIAIAGQTVRLAASGQEETRLARAEPLHQTFIRPDIVDRRAICSRRMSMLLRCSPIRPWCAMPT